jgi:large subunit ribosomal protein L10
LGNREKNEQKVEELKGKLDSAVTVVLTDYRGLNVAEITELRNQLRKAQIEYKVSKNTLTLIAAKDLGLGDLEQFLAGPTAIAFSYKDPVAPAKILSDFTKKSKKLEIKGGVVEGKIINNDGVQALADLPPREELIAKVVGGIKSPLYGLVGVLSGPIRGLVYTLQAIKDKKESN